MRFPNRSDNIVIIASEEAPVISETITGYCSGLSKKYYLKGFWISCNERYLISLTTSNFLIWIYWSILLSGLIIQKKM